MLTVLPRLWPARYLCPAREEFARVTRGQRGAFVGQQGCDRICAALSSIPDAFVRSDNLFAVPEVRQALHFDRGFWLDTRCAWWLAGWLALSKGSVFQRLGVSTPPFPHAPLSIRLPGSPSPPSSSDGRYKQQQTTRSSAVQAMFLSNVASLSSSSLHLVLAPCSAPAPSSSPVSVPSAAYALSTTPGRGPGPSGRLCGRWSLRSTLLPRLCPLRNGHDRVLIAPRTARP